MRAFALVDAENQTIWNGARISPAAAGAVFDEIDRYVARLPTSAAMAHSLLGPYVGVLAGRGWKLNLVNVGPDAADNALLEDARFAISRGYTDLVVVTGDGIFADLADRVRLHVVAYPERLSRRLATAATSVTYLTTPLEVAMAA